MVVVEDFVLIEVVHVEGLQEDFVFGDHGHGLGWVIGGRDDVGGLEGVCCVVVVVGGRWNVVGGLSGHGVVGDGG